MLKHLYAGEVSSADMKLQLTVLTRLHDGQVFGAVMNTQNDCAAKSLHAGQETVGMYANRA